LRTEIQHIFDLSFKEIIQMDNTIFRERIHRQLQKELPGEVSHQKMSPLNRPITSEALKNLTDYRESAVAIVLFEAEDCIECILTQRPEYDGTHSGQVSFPGGKREESDVHLEATARRECKEEIGIQLTENHLIGTLSPVYIPVSRFLVMPYVYFLPCAPIYTPDPHEVAEIFTFPLFDLKKEELISRMELKQPNGTVYRNVPYFDVCNKKVWGATALMLSEMKDILNLID
jgi:8-oxo-dGTP pyrophosphatase MutT (NUDIX family)